MHHIEIIDYRKEHQPYFELFNRRWIEDYFTMEPVDEYVLTNPEEAILKNGGAILMASCDGQIAGTVALRKVAEGVYEFTKMAVGEDYRKRGIAEALSYASFDKAKKLGAEKIILYSNSKKNGAAIKLYEKIGFIHFVPEPGVYVRADVKMEIGIEDAIAAREKYILSLPAKNYPVIKSTPSDIDEIFRLYEEGTAYQKSVAKKHWKGFERSLVEKEIAEGRQWKILIGEQIACVFAVAFNDPFIWQERDRDPALYIHRIATNPLFRGRGLVKKIVAWAKDFAALHDKKFIRMDTGSGNDKLNDYYVSCGFNYLGVAKYGVTGELPEHYKDGESSLFEIAL